ncbi:glycosyltransferase family 4 protein [Allostreptomyces psammosilenae]|uniref:D-inositol 3-phosphate glycosyltransferase n=1 Tax=Allostreptomyces psammosilenae TaxID=1892865 RepID=A0A853AAC0_9ACTN|nr:glycosyltransferase family 4 protein [Allostreptomyces psammosilenae]NYI07458.1 glycosyltransferase involved in cell wall biosynthesis [Allostreptomyces psammosilenae]
MTSEQTPPAVLHLVTDPARRGAQTAAADLHRELRRRGHPSTLAALAPAPPAPDGGRTVPEAAVLGPTRRHPATWRALRRLARRADVVVAHGSTTLPACAVALAGTGTPFVYVNIGDPRHWAADPARRLRTGALLRRAGAVVSLAEGARAAVLAHYRLPAGRVVTIPNGRPVAEYRPPDGPPSAPGGERAAARRALRLPADAPLAAVVAALSPEKRIDLALRAAAAVDGLHVAVAGAGPGAAALARLADDLAPGRVHLLGQLADPRPLYRAADVLLLTSASEGVPGVLVEAALCGVPAVATDVGWVREAVPPDGGVVVPGPVPARPGPGDAAVVRAAADGLRDLLPRAADAGRAARGHALERFDLARTATAWQRLLRDVAAR